MTVFVFRHVADNTIGHLEGLLNHWQQSQTIPSWGYVDLSVCSHPEETLSPTHFQDTTAAIFLGGPMNVVEESKYGFLKPEKALLRWLIEQEIPVLGICLGSQLVASALGATVKKSPVKEIGWTPITLTHEGLQDPVVSVLGQNGLQFQWHEEMWALPEGSTLLGSTADCENQIFRVNERTLGVQYHPEMTLASIESWLKASQSLSEQEKAGIVEQSQLAFEDYHQRNQQFLTAFFQNAGVF
jgi:GMP synthase (glutamine-hydrolysing)